jgi:hypothetical protein
MLSFDEYRIFHSLEFYLFIYILFYLKVIFSFFKQIHEFNNN